MGDILKLFLFMAVISVYFYVFYVFFQHVGLSIWWYIAFIGATVIMGAISSDE
jgi:hypothetical protein